MANSQHLELIKRDIEAWNQWRTENPSKKPDLSGAELCAFTFFEANLSHVDLSSAILVGADFSQADLSNANFTGANLTDAKFEWTNLSGANLTGATLLNALFLNANLNGANLSRSYLASAIFKKSDFEKSTYIETNFTKATLYETIFSCINISDAVGLATVKHDGPSTIGLDTLLLSEHNIPPEFLRGCGVEEAFIRCIEDYFSW